jgi:uncharacterized protein with GYD domain
MLASRHNALARSAAQRRRMVAHPREKHVAKYITLINWTEKGIGDIKNSPDRADKAKALAKKLGGGMQLFMTMGTYDLVGIVDMPNDEAMAKFALNVAAGGHVRTTTLKAFDEEGYRSIINSL